MRLFFAVFPDSETRRGLAAAAQALVLDDESRRVPSENYHMTLAFIGEVSAPLAALNPVGAAPPPAHSRRASMATNTGLRLQWWWLGPPHVPLRSRICAARSARISRDVA